MIRSRLITNESASELNAADPFEISQKLLTVRLLLTACDGLQQPQSRIREVQIAICRSQSKMDFCVRKIAKALH
jgi:hypothetical protein